MIDSTPLETLKALDLSQYPKQKIIKAIRKIGKVPAMVTDFHPGTVIVRARPNWEGEVFSKVSDLSFKPEQYNNSYQRASTPNRTMFYGAVIPSNVKGEDLDNERIIGSCEVCDLLREENIDEGERVVTFGKWRVTKPISVVSIFYPDELKNPTAYLQELSKSYKRTIGAFSKELKGEADRVLDFLASEFAKHPINDASDYCISAVFSEMSIDLGAHGILFPSVRTERRGLNVAIRPEIVNRSMQLEAVMECDIHKKGDHTLINNSKFCLVQPVSEGFQLEVIENPNWKVDDHLIEQVLNGDYPI